ncbi:hypothetical protein D3C80_1601230 [compost metagenome]
MFAKQRHGQCGYDQRRRSEDGVAVRQPDNGEGENGKNNLHGKKDAAADLQPRPVCHDRAPNAARGPCSHQQNEDGEGPVSKHCDEDGRIRTAKMFGYAILRCTDRECYERIKITGLG